MTIMITGTTVRRSAAELSQVNRPGECRLDHAADPSLSPLKII